MSAQIKQFLTFEAVAERSLLMLMMQKCSRLHHNEKNPREGLELLRWSDGPESGFGKCLMKQDANLTRKWTPELSSQWPPQPLGDALQKHRQTAMQCSEMMLAPPSAVAKSATYAAEIERWTSIFPREQLLVIDTDDLTRRRQALMNDTFRFLGLNPVDVGSKSRFCVKGKAGIMDVLNRAEANVSFGPDQKSTLQVGDCDEDRSSMHEERGVLHHNIEPVLQASLRRFYEPHNKRLYRYLNRDLGW